MIVGRLMVMIGADASGVARGAKLTEAQLKKLENTTATVVGRMKGAILALAGPAVMGALVKSSMDLVGNQVDLAKRLDSSVASVQALSRAAELAGISQDEMASAADRMNRRLGEAMRDGASPTNDMLKQLKLSAADLSKMDIDERFIVVSDALKAAGANSAQTADALGQLGIRGAKVINLMQEGGESIRAAREQLQTFGVTLSDVDASKIEAAGDAMTVFQTAITGVGNQLSRQVAPYIIYGAQQFEKMTKAAGGTEKAVDGFVDSAITKLGQILDTIAMVRSAWQNIIPKSSNPEIKIDLDAKALDALDRMAAPDSPVQKAVDYLRALKAGSVDAAQGGQIIIDKWQELRKELGGQLPSEWLAGIQRDAKAAADAIAGAGGGGDGGNKPDPGAALRNQQKAEEAKAMQERLAGLRAALGGEDIAMREHLAKQLRQIQEFEAARLLTQTEAAQMRDQARAEFEKKQADLVYETFEAGTATELEQNARRHQALLEQLKQFELNKTVTTEQGEELRRKIIEDNAFKVAQMQASSWSAGASIVDSAMSDISDVIGKEGEKQFSIMKAISMATALVKGYEAVIGAIAAGNKIGGPAVGAAFGAIAAAGVAAQIAKIAGVGSKSKGNVSAPSGGGGGSSSSSGGGGGQEAQPVGQTLIVSGLRSDHWYRGDNMIALTQALRDHQEQRGGKILIDGR